MDLHPDEGHDGDGEVQYSGWMEIIPVHKKKGGAVYKAEGDGRLRYWDGAFSDEDLKSGNPESLIGELVAGWLEGKY